MSTIPVGTTGFLPLPRIEDHMSGKSRLLVRHLGDRILADLPNVPRYVLRYTVIVLALLGLLGLWEAHGDGHMPVFTSLLPVRGTKPSRISSLHCAAAGVGDQTRWEGLASALAILDEINPPVASWVRQKHEGHQLAFFDDYRRDGDKHRDLARYDVLRGRLIVNRELFLQNDGTVAAILCHEYRHSRQGIPKQAKFALSFVLAEGGDPSIVENDAVVYEQEAYAAIFGGAAETQAVRSQGSSS